MDRQKFVNEPEEVPMVDFSTITDASNLVIDPAVVAGVGDFTEGEKSKTGGEVFLCSNEKAFLVRHTETIEVRTDAKLKKVLTEKYESVMASRYFGAGGIEIVLSGQLSREELEDLVRLSYNLTLA